MNRNNYDSKKMSIVKSLFKSDTLFDVISFKYNSSWEKEFHSNEKIYSFSEPIEIRKGFRSSYTVEKFSKKNKSIEDFSREYTRVIKEKYPKITIHKMTEEKINNFDKAILFNYSIEENRGQYAILNAVLEYNNNFYFFSGICKKDEQMMNYIKIYENVIWSFNII